MRVVLDIWMNDDNDDSIEVEVMEAPLSLAGEKELRDVFADLVVPRTQIYEELEEERNRGIQGMADDYALDLYKEQRQEGERA